jgi:spore maturation protein CgeB
MFKILARSKIVINRHGTIAGNYAVNMRMYEATGSGAMLVTEN